MSTDGQDPPRQRSLTARLVEVVHLFDPLGFISFGGPAANIVMLRKIFVVQEKWVDDKTFTDLFALGNALPGPPFSQLAFSIALLRGGYLPALLSFIFLTSSSCALTMLGLGFGVRHIPSTLPDIVFALFTGLNSAAVGLITLAAYNLSSKVITDPLTRIEVLLSAAFASCYDAQWLYPVLMAAEGIATLVWDWWFARSNERLRETRQEQETPRGEEIVEADQSPRTAFARDIEKDEPLATPVTIAAPPVIPSSVIPGSMASTTPLHTEKSTSSYSHQNTNPPVEAVETSATRDSIREPQPVYFSLTVRGGLCICAAFVIFLVTVLIVRATTDTQRAFDFFVNLLLAGTIIFGGGPVVIPLLRSYTVDPGWVDPRDFLLGFAVIQAVPGPLFNFSVFLSVLTLPSQPVLGALLGCVAIFLPGIVLKIGLLPLYTRWKRSRIARSVLRGLNASAVGLIFAATYRLLRVGFISPNPGDPTAPVAYASLDQDGWWVVIIATTFVACEWFGLPAPAAIAGGAVGGVAWWGVRKT